MRVTDHQSVHQNHHDAGDRADDRPMTVSDIEGSYVQIAELLHRFEWADRLLTGRYRRARFADVEGRVLDVACRTGTNFRYLPDDVDLVGMYVSSEMLSKAEHNLTQSDLSGRLHQMDAQDLEFPDNSFDTVISSLVTCTFPDPVVAL
jgi:ubiquinone/menaquinone biosynthesis C-methylase UbiE